jgi:hypothetical protein
VTQYEALIHVECSLNREGRQLINEGHGAYILCMEPNELRDKFYCEWAYGDYGFDTVTNTGPIHSNGCFVAKTTLAMAEHLSEIFTECGL